MSVCSAISDLSVSYYGEEMGLEEALDDCFKKIQTFVNDCHCSVRTLAMLPEQDGDYMVALDQYHSIIESIDGMTDLMKELKSIAKEVLGKPPTEIKQQVAAKVLEFKQKQLRVKMDAKKKKQENLEEVKEE
jgi:hypothetical protein